LPHPTSDIPAQACICVTRHEEPHTDSNFQVTPSIAQQHHPKPRLQSHRSHIKTMHKTATATKPVEQRSRFPSLPPELRLIIYSFAPQDTISAIEATSFRHIAPSKKSRPPIVGALALLFTSSEIQAESSDAMRSSFGVLARWSSTQNDIHFTQLKHAATHDRDLGDRAGWESLWVDHSGRMRLINSARLIIMMAYSNSQVKMYKRGRR
jgi:hypothetical protein